MKKLIIAEKPSLCRTLVSAIPEHAEKREGYYETDSYYISYAYGHLFELVDLEDYFPKTENQKWTLDNLPFCPASFRFALKKDSKTKKTDPEIRKQFLCLKGLMNSENVDSIIHCGDADREGEVIVRLIINNGLKNYKPVFRLWLPEQTTGTIRNALQNLRPDAEYDNLFNEGLARTCIDWEYGINFTRLATLKAGSLMRVGRVVTPIVKAIYDREMERKNFVPVKFWKAVLSCKKGDMEFKLNSKVEFPFSEKEKADQYAAKLSNADLVVTDISKKSVKQQPGKLFSLSKLQGELGRKYKMSMKESMSCVQQLYEEGYLTYPRTNTEYLAENEKDRIEKILSKLRQKGFDVEQKAGKRIYDDSKIESHSAITSTEKIADPESMEGKKGLVYLTVLNRFLAVFCSEECVIDKTTVTITASGIEEFKISGSVVRNQGFLKYENGKQDSELPKFEKGEIVKHLANAEERETKPPASYTLESLNEFLKNPLGKNKTSESDDEEYAAILAGVEIGTEATRTGIIDNAISSGYISLKNNSYGIEPKGIAMIHLLSELGIDVSVETSVEMSKMLKRVYKGSATVDDALEAAITEIKKGFSKKDTVVSAKAIYKDNKNGNAFCKCPKCKSDILESPKSYYCTNKNCGVILWKDNKYFSSLGYKMSKTDARKLLTSGKTLAKNLVSKRDPSKKYDAYIIADFSKGAASFRMEFPKNGNGKKKSG